MSLTDRARPEGAQRGSTLVELTIAAGLFTVVLLSSLAMIRSSQRFSGSTLEITAAEDLTQQMLFRIERTITNASALEAETSLTVQLNGAQQGTLQTVSTDGMPPAGVLLLDRGLGVEERLAYGQLNVDGRTVSLLDRGMQCTAAGTHAVGASVLWTGLAMPIGQQVNPPASAFDGRVLVGGTPTFYRGDGTGLSYRVPIDPTGGNTLLAADELVWGAEVGGVGPTEDGRSAIYFEPQDEFDEAAGNMDVNGDGDRVDVFDVGQLRRVSWDVTAPNMDDDVGLGPSMVIQERCNWGGDLDGDGFDDPIFLWDPDSNQVHVRIFILGESRTGLSIVRSVESEIFLRNQPEL